MRLKSRLCEQRCYVHEAFRACQIVAQVQAAIAVDRVEDANGLAEATECVHGIERVEPDFAPNARRLDHTVDLWDAGAAVGRELVAHHIAREAAIGDGAALVERVYVAAMARRVPEPAG